MAPTHTHTPATPAHVAVIMDGNGRWATARGLDRSMGHAEGVNTVRRITEAAIEAGVKYLTLYTFSTENWQRPAAEVEALMHLIATAIERETPDLVRNGVRLAMIGDTDRLPTQALGRLRHCMELTAGGTALTLTLALSYSARWELLRAARLYGLDVAAGRVDPATGMDTEAQLERYLTTAGMPDPDLLIRTGGDMRLSNYLLWQIAYAEIYVTDTYWPDFTRQDFFNALDSYGSRERRYGLTSAQVSAQGRDTGRDTGCEANRDTGH